MCEQGRDNALIADRPLQKTSGSSELQIARTVSGLPGPDGSVELTAAVNNSAPSARNIPRMGAC